MSSAPWLLIISKHPEYTETGEVVLGQCEPYTPGWRLHLFREGEEIVLLEGTYYDLRKVQTECAGKSIEEIKQIAETAKHRVGRSSQSTVVIGRPEDADASSSELTQTATLVGLEPTQLLGTEEISEAIAKMQHPPPPAEADDDETGEYVAAETTAGKFETVKRDGVVVARPLDPSILENGDQVVKAFNDLMAEGDGALVIDIGKVETLGSEAANAVGRYTESSEQEGRFVALANVREEIVGVLQDLEKAGKITGTLVAYPEVDMAVAEAIAFLKKA